jgi:hypothetical protein
MHSNLCAPCSQSAVVYKVHEMRSTFSWILSKLCEGGGSTKRAADQQLSDSNRSEMDQDKLGQHHEANQFGSA